MTPPDLSDTAVVVTGAGGRLGRILVARVVAAGARVVALDAVAPDDLPDGVAVRTADLTDEAAVEAAFAEAEQEAGALGALVHAVGMWDGQPLAETPLADWRRMLDVNLTSAFLCFREAARRMGTPGGGRLVAIASRQGADRGVAEQAAYSASKAGVVRLVEAAAAEYEGRITAAAVAPSTLLFDGDGGGGVAAEAVADLCVYLCGDGGAIHNGAVLRAYGTA